MRTTSRSRAASALVVAAAAVLSLAACGGGGGDSAAATSKGSTTSGSTAGGDFSAFRDCLKEHGVDLPDGFGQRGQGQGQPPPDGQPGPGFADDPKAQEAFNACRDKAPAGGFGGGRNTAAFDAYASCLRDHGVDVPDPSTSTSTGQSTSRPSIDRNDPSFAAANQACQALLPTPSSTTSTTASS